MSLDIDTKRDIDSAFSLNPLTICVVSSWFPSKEHPFRSLFVLAFIRRIKKMGVAVRVITTRELSDPAFETINEVPVYRMRERLPFLNMFRLLAKLKPDVIHIHAPNFFSGFGIITARLLRIPVIATVHKVEVQPLGSICLEMIRRIMLLLCDQLVVVSKATRKLTEECGIPANRLHVVYNSADEDSFKPRSREKARDLLNLPPEDAIILFVGRLEPVKGTGFLIRAMPLILRKQKAMLLILGHGSQQSVLEDMVKKLNLRKHVFFLSKISTVKLALYYNAADVFVLPSLVEGHSVVLLEAMASGLPIVATNVGGNNETIMDQVNGFLVRPKNPEELSKAITTILGEEKLRLEFSKKSIHLYNRDFSEKIQVANYFSRYEELLGTCRSKLQIASEELNNEK